MENKIYTCLMSIWNILKQRVMIKGTSPGKAKIIKKHDTLFFSKGMDVGKRRLRTAEELYEWACKRGGEGNMVNNQPSFFEKENRL